MSISILHLTDLHAGPGSLADSDIKDLLLDTDYCSPRERKSMLERLESYLTALPKPPDFVVVSGDFTLQGQPGGFQETAELLIRLIESEKLPPANKFMVVPGNHDVVWGVKDSPRDKQRYQPFFEAFGRHFPHCYLNECDPECQTEFELGKSKFIGGVKAKLQHGKPYVEVSLPYLLDLERDLLLFGFNSSVACGVFLDDKGKIGNKLTAIMQSDSFLSLPEKKRDKLTKGLKEIATAHEKQLLVDAGQIGDQQFKLFSKIMTNMRNKLGAKFASLTKIAVLHHHIGHLHNQQLELKRFEMVVDAAQLKQALIEFGFDMVLHGHKHTNHVGIDGSVIPITEKRQSAPLCVVSGGTVGGVPRLGDQPSFKLIELSGSTGPRTSALIQEIPLLQTADPTKVIRKQEKLYHIDLAFKSPEVHDIDELKVKIDDLIARTSAPELYESNGLRAEKLVIPNPIPELATGDSPYRPFAYQEVKGVKLFYDVLIAAEPLKFKQLARIHWLVSDVYAYQRTLKKSCKVIILIGDLDATSFRRSASVGDVRNSINELMTKYSPAIKKKFLQVKRCPISQAMLDETSRSLSP